MIQIVILMIRCIAELAINRISKENDYTAYSHNNDKYPHSNDIVFSVYELADRNSLATLSEINYYECPLALTETRSLLLCTANTH
ncbi:GSCOCT00014202001.2-RA-CDS [Cotesia congregata]|uniref:Cc_single_36.5 n=2 Tax=root TaxID=1 RepID=S6CVN4_COTCN|nr:hypothetical protein CcBV_36.5 [Bracoviriform congregatae]CAD6243472.1 GSCOCT00014202001.2-RA-CDS [Cotesia congregata]CAG17507.1 hypothetical protein CcBV_36.5 [Bracoviriform congregatae]CAG5092389.1 cc_single_36.5 [Cotesia congregata]CCQ71158.1 hypothetical protein CcBV_36.5 [Cotesia congregata]